jgi:hypothetical protein
MPETLSPFIMTETKPLSELGSQLRRSVVTIEEKFRQLKRLLNITADGLEDHVASTLPLDVQYVQILVDAASFPVSVAYSISYQFTESCLSMLASSSKAGKTKSIMEHWRHSCTRLCGDICPKALPRTRGTTNIGYSCALMFLLVYWII